MIDVAIVVAIMGVLAAVGATMYRNRLPIWYLKGATSAVVTTLRTARMQARSEGLDVEVAIVSNTCTRLMSRIDRDGNGSYDSSEIRELDLNAYRDIKLDGNVLKGAFDGIGAFDCAAGMWEVTVKSAAGKKYVYVFAGGEVQQSDDAL